MAVGRTTHLEPAFEPLILVLRAATQHRRGLVGAEVPVRAGVIEELWTQRALPTASFSHPRISFLSQP